ncbi:hypothetical protein R83H12_02386 [Fibrobacteria bacterium R8-3-H12]
MYVDGSLATPPGGLALNHISLASGNCKLSELPSKSSIKADFLEFVFEL